MGNIFGIEQTSPNAIPISSKALGFILTVFAGGSRFNHYLLSLNASIMEQLFNAKRLDCVATTISRLFAQISNLKLANKFSARMWSYMEKLIPWASIKSDWLSFDSTILERYGNQEGAKRGYNPRKPGRPSHHPLLAFLSNSRYVVGMWNRSGNCHSNNNIIPFFQEVYRRLYEHIEIRGVLADTGFYNEKFLTELENNNLCYIVGVALYKNVQRRLAVDVGWESVGHGIEYKEFYFKQDCWQRERRYVGIRRCLKTLPNAVGKQLSFWDDQDQRYRYSCYVTNLSDAPDEIHQQYRCRAREEQRIGELKYDFAFDGFSSKSFYGTEAALWLVCLCFNLYILFAATAFPASDHVKRLRTVRYEILITAGVLGRDGRSKCLRLALPKRQRQMKLQAMYIRLESWSGCFDGNCTAVGRNEINNTGN